MKIGVQGYCPCPRFLSPAPIPFCPRRGQQIRKSRTKWYTGNMCVCKYVPARNDPFWTLCKTCLPQYELNLNPVWHFMTPIRPNATHFMAYEHYLNQVGASLTPDWPNIYSIWTQFDNLWPKLWCNMWHEMNHLWWIFFISLPLFCYKWSCITHCNCTWNYLW